MNITVRINTDDEIFIPEKKSEAAAGFDLKAAVDEPVRILPGQRKLISTGIKLEIPLGYEGQIRPRSGLALKHGITILNSPGTIDSDYRGDVGIILYNAGEDVFTIKKGDRIAQILFSLVYNVEFEPSLRLESSYRGAGGFGSTGL